MAQLIAFRALQGIGGGIVMSNSAVAVADLYAPEERGKYVGLLGLVYAVSSVIGPVLAGVITDSVSWSWIFLLNVPLGIPVLLLLVRYFLRITPVVESRRLDYPGMVTLTLAVVPVMLALSVAGDRYTWASPRVAGLLAFGLAMAAAFVVIESRSEFPIMPLEIYRNRMVAAAVVVTFLTGFGLYGTILFTPLFFQGVQGASATGSGGLLTPIMLGMVVGAVVSGQLLSRKGARYRLQAIVSTGAMTSGIYLLSTMNQETGFLQAIAYIVIRGLGMGGTALDVGRGGAELGTVPAGRHRDVHAAFLPAGQRRGGTRGAGRRARRHKGESAGAAGPVRDRRAASRLHRERGGQCSVGGRVARRALHAGQARLTAAGAWVWRLL